ncbi:MAG: TolC family protein [Elusimicrobia bacterium]|nr:TolC family protein [Elusimicrobiota bacterium]
MKVKIIVLAALALLPAGFTAAQDSAKIRELTIEEAVQTAFLQNTGVVIAEKTREIYEERVNQYWGSVFPSIGASAQYTRNIEKPSFFIMGNKVTIGSDNSYQASLDVNQVLWAGGKVGAGIKIAGLAYKIGDEESRSVKLAVARAVRRMFYNVLLASATVAIQQESLDLAKSHLSTIKEQFKQGLASDLELLRQKVEVSNAMPALTKAENLYEEGILELGNLLGMDVDERAVPAGSLECFVPADADLPRLYAQALGNRPETRRAGLGLDLADRKISLEKSAFYPSLYGFASKQFQGQSQAGFPNPIGRAWSLMAGARLSLPLFSGGADYYKVKQARLERDQAWEMSAQARRLVKMDVKRAWLSLYEADERLESQSEAVEQAKKVMQATQIRFKNGLVSRLEFNDAALALNRSETLRAQAQRDVCAAGTDLDWATGKLVKE